MGRQIRFFFCPSIRTAIKSETHRIGATLLSSYSSDESAIQFPTSVGTDTHPGRLWTQAADVRHYQALCRAVKKDSVYDREAGLWVKRASRAAFDAYRAEREKALSELVERVMKVKGSGLGNWYSPYSFNSAPHSCNPHSLPLSFSSAGWMRHSNGPSANAPPSKPGSSSTLPATGGRG
jgi:hypothetical protein